jgi:hypothetical protein
MDLKWQPTGPEGGGPADPELGPATPLSIPAEAHPTGRSLRRTIATVALAIGLLTVGGVSVVAAASPDPSASTSPSTTNGTGGTTTPHARGDCPNMGSGSGSGSGNGSASPGTTPSS